MLALGLEQTSGISVAIAPNLTIRYVSELLPVFLSSRSLLIHSRM
jgi:hypothetical protein